MTQSVFRDLCQLKKELKETRASCCVFAALFFVVFVWRAILAWVVAFAVTAIWPTVPIWPVFGLFFAISFFLPQS